MKTASLFIPLLVTCLFTHTLCSSTFAADPDLENLIKKCKEFEGNPQIKPFKTNVFCRGKRTFWEIKAPDAFDLDTQFTVYNRAEMKDNQHDLPEALYNMASTPSWLNCRIYREMLVVIPSVVTTFSSCAELEQMAKLGRDKFCKKVLEGMGEEEQAVPTGKTFSTCPEEAGTGPLSHLGAEFRDVEVKSEGTIYHGPKILRITDAMGFIAQLGLSAEDVILFVNNDKVLNLVGFIEKLTKLIGKGDFKIVALKAGTHQLSSYKGTL